MPQACRRRSPRGVAITAASQDEFVAMSKAVMHAGAHSSLALRLAMAPLSPPAHSVTSSESCIVSSVHVSWMSHVSRIAASPWSANPGTISRTSESPSKSAAEATSGQPLALASVPSRSWHAAGQPGIGSVRLPMVMLVARAAGAGDGGGRGGAG